MRAIIWAFKCCLPYDLFHHVCATECPAPLPKAFENYQPQASQVAVDALKSNNQSAQFGAGASSVPPGMGSYGGMQQMQQYGQPTGAQVCCLFSLLATDADSSYDKDHPPPIFPLSLLGARSLPCMRPLTARTHRQHLPLQWALTRDLWHPLHPK